MLLHDELNTILAKDSLKLEDLILLEDHLLFIAGIEQEHLYLPNDVIENLNRDVDLILERLKKQRLHMQKAKLTLLISDK